MAAIAAVTCRSCSTFLDERLLGLLSAAAKKTALTVLESPTLLRRALIFLCYTATYE